MRRATPYPRDSITVKSIQGAKLAQTARVTRFGVHRFEKQRGKPLRSTMTNNGKVVKNYWLARKSAVVGQNGRPRRKDIPPGDVLCFHCPAKCCQYIALPIDRPKTWEGFDTVRWFLLHERTAVFVDNGQWYLLVYLTCKALQPNGRCAIYENRPTVCRDYGTDVCEFEENAVYDQFFETAEQLEEYAEAILGPRSGGSIRGPQPGHEADKGLPPLALPVAGDSSGCVHREK